MKYLMKISRRKALIGILFIIPLNVFSFPDGGDSIRSMTSTIIELSMESVGLARTIPPHGPPPDRGCSRNPHGGCPVSPIR